MDNDIQIQMGQTIFFPFVYIAEMLYDYFKLKGFVVIILLEPVFDWLL